MVSTERILKGEKAILLSAEVSKNLRIMLISNWENFNDDDTCWFLPALITPLAGNVYYQRKNKPRFEQHLVAARATH
jgi:hypothetical protein